MLIIYKETEKYYVIVAIVIWLFKIYGRSLQCFVRSWMTLCFPVSRKSVMVFFILLTGKEKKKQTEVRVQLFL